MNASELSPEIPREFAENVNNMFTMIFDGFINEMCANNTLKVTDIANYADLKVITKDGMRNAEDEKELETELIAALIDEIKEKNLNYLLNR